MLDVGHHGKAVGALVRIWRVANHSEKKVPEGSPAGELEGLLLGSKPTAAVTLTG